MLFSAYCKPQLLLGLILFFEMMSESGFNLSLLLKDSIAVSTTLGSILFSRIPLKTLFYDLLASSVADENPDVRFLFLAFK